MRVVIALVATLALASSAALARKSRHVPVYSQLARAPDSARLQVNPFEADAEAIAGGKKLYDRHCASCHGAGGVDGSKGPALRVPEVQGAPPGALFWVITNGSVREGMPVWSRLPEPQRWQITSYVLSLGVR